ncbi:MAG: hypothetical protein ABSG66_05025 [Stellaceae bacterium]
MWRIHYKTGTVAGLRLVNSLPFAISQACDLLSNGADVSQIESRDGLKILHADEIRLAYAGWKAR